MKKKSGFTLIELILMITIFAVVTSTAMFSLSAFFTNNQLDTYGDQVVHQLRKAQSNSVMRIKDSQWGVYFNDDLGGINGSFTFFRGGTYALRDESYDDNYDLPDVLTLSNISLNGGGSEVVFTKVKGETNQSGSLKINDANGKFYTLLINDLGQIQIN